MQVNNLFGVILIAMFTVGCGSSSAPSKNETAESRAANTDLLSIDGELFPLSPFFGVCAKRAEVLRANFSNGMLSSHYPTYVEITGGGGVLKITVGKFGFLPGENFRDVPASSTKRRIQIGSDRFGSSSVLVSDFQGAGSNRVNIEYDKTDVEAEAGALRLANAIVACHISEVASQH